MRALCVVSLASLTSALFVFFGESFIQLCFQEIVSNVQCREHGQADAIDRVCLLGNGTHLRVDVFSEFHNVLGIAAAPRARA